MKNTLVGSLLLIAGVAVIAQAPYLDPRPANAPHQKPAFAGQYRAPERKSNVAFDQTAVVSGLQSPWAIAFLPGGKMLVTEKTPGRLRVVNTDGTLVATPVAGVPTVDGRGQGGLLGLALDPNFATSRLVYFSFSEPQADGTNNTAVARGRFVDDAAAPRLENVQVIFHQVPSLQSNAHFGGRLVFGRDGTLFITMGDRSAIPGRMQAQKMDSLIGKIARVNADGSVPKDNPFVGKEGVRPEIWSFGHRNVQSATLHPATGELWEVEHGTNGGDEVNIASKGKDYGWPTIAYGIEYQGGRITGAERDDVLHGQRFPGVERQPLHRGTRQQRAGTPRGRRREGGRRGALPAGEQRAHPRRGAGTGWLPVCADRSARRARRPAPVDGPNHSAVAEEIETFGSF